MPKNPTGRHLGNQFVRSGTSPAFNYGEARAAESKRDFVHKMRVVHKELNETNINLMIIYRSNLLPGTKLSSIMDERDQSADMQMVAKQRWRQRLASTDKLLSEDDHKQ